MQLFSSVADQGPPRWGLFHDASDDRYELYLPITTHRNGRSAGNDPAIMRFRPQSCALKSRVSVANGVGLTDTRL